MAVEAVAHPPEFGRSVAGPAHVRRDEEMKPAAGHVVSIYGLRSRLSRRCIGDGLNSDLQNRT